MKRTFNPSNLHRARTHGFRARMATKSGRRIAGPPPCQGPQEALPVTRSLQGRFPIRKLTFEPRKRLHQPAEFRDVKRRGKKFSDAFFSLSVLANHETHARLGLSIATRTFGTAVARNRIKRLARESFRLNQHSCRRSMLPCRPGKPRERPARANCA